MSRLKPWETLPVVSCELCEDQALYRVTAQSWRHEQLADRPEWFSALACEAHCDELRSRTLDACPDQRRRIGISRPLRWSWTKWIDCQGRESTL